MASTIARAVTLHGRQLTLDAALPALEGQRVSITTLDEPGVVLSADSQRVLWQEWRERGPHGPIDDDEGTDFP